MFMLDESHDKLFGGNYLSNCFEVVIEKTEEEGRILIADIKQFIWGCKLLIDFIFL